MKPNKTLYVTSRAAWRAWLSGHHDRESEIWLVFYKKHTNRPRVSYEDAVEEGLCFGWIDSLVTRLDDDRYAQKFTPRKTASTWTESNRRRYEKLRAAGLIAPPGLAKAPPPAGATAAPPSYGAGKDVIVPAYIARGLRKRPRAWRNFEAMAPSYRRLYVRWIDAAKREDTRERRLAEAAVRLAENRKPGLK